MTSLDYKREIGPLDGRPEKRLFWSIINDYDPSTAICELIDNAIDLWMLGGRKRKLSIDIELDCERQLIRIEDNAGGVRVEDLRLLVAPGASANLAKGETIGVFGVGSKRAVVALAERVSIRTRFRDKATFQIDIDPAWLSSDGWDIPYYQVPDIAEGTTVIELSALRKSLTTSLVSGLRSHIGETYSWFLAIDTCSIRLNGVAVEGTEFDAWAFPPDNPPHCLRINIPVPDGGNVAVEITAGLILDRIPEAENYGVYFYCNNRLIAKEVKDREVGYISRIAGVPHPDASLCRAIVRITGAARSMPWNSSKTRVVYSHTVFQAIQHQLSELVAHFSSLSRRLKEEWPTKVFAFPDGAMREIAAADAQGAKHLRLPPLPQGRPKAAEKLRAMNRKQLEDQPWTLGLLESVSAVDVVSRQRFQTKHRISLILLDSTFEIALKEFIVHRPDLFPSPNLKQLFEKRENVIQAVTAKVHIREKLIERAKHYYLIRNKMIHERATIDVTEADIANYRKTVQKVLNILFKLKFEEDPSVI